MTKTMTPDDAAAEIERLKRDRARLMDALRNALRSDKYKVIAEREAAELLREIDKALLREQCP